MYNYLFYRFYNDSAILMGYAKAETIQTAFQKVNFTCYSLNDVFIEIMEIYDLCDTLNSWIEDSSQTVSQGKKASKHYIERLKDISRTDNNMLFDFLIDQMESILNTSRKDTGNLIALLKNCLRPQPYFKFKQKCLKEAQKNLLAHIGNNILIEQESCSVIYNYQNVVATNINKYIDDNDNVYTVITDSILSLIMDVSHTIAKKGFVTLRCANCNKFFILDKSHKRKTCSEECRKKHNTKVHKERLGRNLSNADMEYEYNLYSKRAKYRLDTSKELGVDTLIAHEFEQMISAQLENLLEIKKKVNLGELSYEDFSKTLSIYDKKTKELFAIYKGEIKNGEYQETQ